MAFSFGNNKLVSYLRESREELRKVVWPDRKTIVRDTLVVIAISVGTAVFFGALDFGLTEGFQKLLDLAANRL